MAANKVERLSPWYVAFRTMQNWVVSNGSEGRSTAARRSSQTTMRATPHGHSRTCAYCRRMSRRCRSRPVIALRPASASIGTSTIGVGPSDSIRDSAQAGSILKARIETVFVALGDAHVVGAWHGGSTLICGDSRVISGGVASGTFINNCVAIGVVNVALRAGVAGNWRRTCGRSTMKRSPSWCRQDRRRSATSTSTSTPSLA